MSLYKLVTTENVDLNYKAFKKDELIDCILNLRTTYFRLKKENEENEQLKDNWNKLKEYFNERIEVCDNRLSSPFCNFEKATKERLIFSQCLEKLEELEGSDSMNKEIKFKVGDKIKGISDEYEITNKDMYLGEIKEISKYYIEILVLEHKNPKYIGETCIAEAQTGRFEIVENLTISQLQSEIDKLSNKVQKEYSNVISNRDKVNYLKNQLKQLKEENKKEKNKPILDDVEKEYLKNVIKPFRNRTTSIGKGSVLYEEKEFIYIETKEDADIILPYFKKNTMYKGMEAGKRYTLEELGL